MSGVFQTPSPPGDCVPFGAGEDTLAGWGVNSSEEARHCSVLYIYKYFVGYTYKTSVLERSSRERSGDERERKTGKEKNRENGGLLEVNTLCALVKM
jgi:hypothetical protein